MQQPRHPFLVVRGDSKDTKWYADQGYHAAWWNDARSSWAKEMLGADGVPTFATVSHEQAARLPEGLRYLHCTDASGKTLFDGCKVLKYDCHCDSAPGSSKCGGQASWHGGWREHRFAGHLIGSFILDALSEALSTLAAEWPVAPSLWHITPLMQAQEQAFGRIAERGGTCETSSLHRFLGCNQLWQGATDFTPRVGGSLHAIAASNSFHVHRRDEQPPAVTPAGAWTRDLWLSSGCSLAGSLDGRGSLDGDPQSGVLVLELPRLEHGQIVVNSLGTMHSTMNWGTEAVPMGRSKG